MRAIGSYLLPKPAVREQPSLRDCRRVKQPKGCFFAPIRSLAAPNTCRPAAR